MSANISYSAVKTLHRIYLDGNHKTLTDVIGKDETQTMWFELNDATRTFLTSVLQHPDATGIRVYLLQNPTVQTQIEGDIYPLNPLDIGQLTTALVATKLSAGQQTDIETDIQPLNHSANCPSNCV